MNARVVLLAACAAVVLSACGTSPSGVTAPLSDGTGTPGLNPSVALSVLDCEPGFWCVAAGANAATSTDTTSIETSAGGHGRWATVATPELSGATLTAAGCWASGCLLGGSSPAGTVVVLVNAKRRDASALSSRPGGSGIPAITCTGPGRCLALVTSATATSVFRTTDSGASWKELSTLPTALQAGTALSCANSARCVAVGTSPAGGVAAWSRDGGVTWSTSTAPRDVVSFTAVACAPVTWCVATARLRTGHAVALRSANVGRSWVPLATTVVSPDAVTCTVVRWCVVAGGGAGGGEIAVYATAATVSLLTLAYVPDPVIALGCATPRKCAGITPESTISFVA